MAEKTKVNAMTKFTVFLGIYLLAILTGIPWIWGNLAVYVTSYCNTRVDGISMGVTNWLLGANVIGFSVGVLMGGPIARKMGTRAICTLGVFTFNAGILLTYFSVSHSSVAFCISFGLVPGISSGVIQSGQLILIVRWTNRYHGLSTSSVVSSSILGAVVMNFLLTFFINPHNRSPSTTKDDFEIFTQPDLIDRVPYAFLMFGGVSLVLNVIGLMLIRDHPGRDNVLKEMFLRIKTSPHERIPLRSRPPQSIHDEIIICSHEENQDERMANLNNSTSHDITPREALKRPEFYALCIFVVVQNYSFFILNTYYKEFGLIYIPDDHFLTAVVMVKCLSTPACSWLAGVGVDKFGTKLTTVIMSTMFCIISGFFYLTTVNKWLYLFSCVVYGCSLFSLYSLTSACCVNLFGKTHFTTILGMTMTSNYVTYPGFPPLFQWIIATYDWFVLFSSAGFLALFNVILLILWLPEKNLLK